MSKQFRRVARQIALTWLPGLRPNASTVTRVSNTARNPGYASNGLNRTLVSRHLTGIVGFGKGRAGITSQTIHGYEIGGAIGGLAAAPASRGLNGYPIPCDEMDVAVFRTHRRDILLTSQRQLDIGRGSVLASENTEWAPPAAISENGEIGLAAEQTQGISQAEPAAEFARPG